MRKVVVISILFIAFVFVGCNADMNIESSNQNDEQNFTETNEPSKSTVPQEEAEAPSVIPDDKNTKREYECNIPFDFSKHTERVSFPLSTTDGFDEMINELKKIDPSFSSEGYKVWINTNAGNESGSIKFTYFIENEIQTNKTYLFSVRNGAITKLLSIERPFPQNQEEFEKELLERVNEFKASYERENLDMTNVVEIRERYLYNYDTGELRYVHSVFREVEGVIADEVTEIIID